MNRSGYVNNDYLYFLSSQPTSSSGSYTVSVAKGYLALRSAKAYDSSNEIGQLYSGDTVQLIDTSDSQYWYVYSQKLGKNGYVNKDYLIGGTTTYATRQSVLLPVIWLCALRRLTTLPTRSDSYIPAIQFSLWIQLMHSTGIFTPRNSANMVM